MDNLLAFDIFNKKLNNIYKESPPLYQIEDSWQGFEWISANESQNNIFSFIRKDLQGNKLIVLLNFSGNDYKDYKLGLEKGKYKMIICTDLKMYGGKGLVKKRNFIAKKEKAHGKNYSIKF